MDPGKALLQQTEGLFDHLIGQREWAVRHGQSERLGVALARCWPACGYSKPTGPRLASAAALTKPAVATDKSLVN
jgi:hypothetical protein